MFDLEKIIRPNILSLKPYSSARSEFTSKEGVFLDANENPFGHYNRYPDPVQKLLKSKISDIKLIEESKIFIGNGSDEIIDLCFRIFCEPGKDKVLVFEPTYGMYEVSAAINDIEILKLNLDENFQLDKATSTPYLQNENIKIIFICSPNNPTGNSIEDIAYIVENFNGIVIIDEAYIDFSVNKSWINKIDEHPNIIVVQTLSKAWGMAALRIGMAFSSPLIIDYLNKIKPPYNVSAINQQFALEILGNTTKFELERQSILSEKAKLIAALHGLSFIIKIYPSDANFILVKVTDADIVYQKLIQQHIIVRNRTKEVKNCIRISIGTPEENNILINSLNTIQL